MKYIAKMMLALLASVTLVIPAYAWDFGASGSMSTTFNQTTVKLNEDADAITSMGVGSDAGAITLSSSNTDGDTTGSLSYKLDWDGNLDEVWTLSGSSKAGKWTASSSIDYNNDDGAQTAADTPALTLTDGTLTIVMGSASHIGSASRGAGDSVASGKVQWQALDDYDIGAAVDSFQGVSVGYKLDDTSSITIAIQAGADGALGITPLTTIGAASAATADTIAYGSIVTAYNNYAAIHGLGTISANADNTSISTTGDNLSHYNSWAASDNGTITIAKNTTAGTAAGTASTATKGSSGFGLTYAGTFGDIGVDFVYASATGKSNDSNVKQTIGANTMSVAVGMDMGDIDPYLTYATYKSWTNSGESGAKDAGVQETGMRVGTTVALGDDSIGIEYTTTTAKGLETGAKSVSETGIEAGYATTLGPATLSVGYGTYTITDGDGVGPYRTNYGTAPAADYGKGGTMSDLEVKLAYSF